MQEFNVGVDYRTDLKNVRIREKVNVKVPDHMVINAAMKLMEEGFIKDESRIRYIYRRLFNQLMKMNERNVEKEYRYVSNKWQAYWMSHHSREARSRYLKELNENQYNQKFEEDVDESASDIESE